MCICQGAPFSGDNLQCARTIYGIMFGVKAAALEGSDKKKLTSSPFQLYGFKVLMGMYDFFYTGWAPKIAKLPYKRFNYGL